MDAVAESGNKERNLRVTLRFSLSVENGSTDAGPDGRTCLAGPNSQAQTETRKENNFPVQLTASRTSNRARSIHTLLKALTIHAKQILSAHPEMADPDLWGVNVL